jgi:hypothetical protein
LAGYLSKSFSVGGSVAKAKEAKVSIIKFNQSKCKGVTISCLITADPIKVIKTATMLKKKKKKIYKKKIKNH